MRKTIPYVWLFISLWIVICSASWLGNDWIVYYDRGNGPEAKFHLKWDEQLVISAISGLVYAAAITVFLRFVALWLTSKPIPMG